jgi:dephospho-CoA kinase
LAGRLLRIGLTGGIATGKSTCLRQFAALGVPTIDSDTIARDLVEPGTPGLAAVVNRFGSGVLRADGSLDRAALGRLVFSDEAARRDLEAIIHPAVFARMQEWFEFLEVRQVRQVPKVSKVSKEETLSCDRARLAVADVPLLFEAGREDYFDVIVVAACRPDQQLARLMARDGLTETAARRRIAAQWPLDQKRARADYVIDTSGTQTEAETQVKDFLRSKIVSQTQPSNSQGEE